MTVDAQDEPKCAIPFTLIAAMDENGLIGADGGMPWHLSGDLRWFKQNTVGKTVVMGRRTFESIGRALPDRRNIVVTRNSAFSQPGIEVAFDLDQVGKLASKDSEVMVIGGAQIYTLALPRAGRLLITRIEGCYEGDTWFPEVDWSQWELRSEISHPKTETDPGHRFLDYRRVVA